MAPFAKKKQVHQVKLAKYLFLVHGISKISVTVCWSLMSYFLQFFRVSSTLQNRKKKSEVGHLQRHSDINNDKMVEDLGQRKVGTLKRKILEKRKLHVIITTSLHKRKPKPAQFLLSERGTISPGMCKDELGSRGHSITKCCWVIFFPKCTPSSREPPPIPPQHFGSYLIRVTALLASTFHPEFGWDIY